MGLNMVTPVNNTYNIHFVLPEKMTDADRAFFSNLMRPVVPPPETANVDPQSSDALEKSKSNLASYPKLSRVVHQLLNAMNKVLKVMAYPAYFVGGLLLAFGLAKTIFLLGATLSITILLKSEALVILLLGATLYKFGEDLIKDKDINTVLGNLIYIPLPFLAALGKQASI